MAQRAFRNIRFRRGENENISMDDIRIVRRSRSDDYEFPPSVHNRKVRFFGGRRSKDDMDPFVSPSNHQSYDSGSGDSADEGTGAKGVATRLARNILTFRRRRTRSSSGSRTTTQQRNDDVASFASDGNESETTSPNMLDYVNKQKIAGGATSYPRKNRSPVNMSVEVGGNNQQQQDPSIDALGGGGGGSAHGSTGYADMEYGNAAASQPHRAGQRARYSVYHGTTKRKFRVRPYHCFPDHRTMTEEDIYADSLKPSKEFARVKSSLSNSSPERMWKIEAPPEIEALYGSPKQDGRIGGLRVEVLGCVALDRTKPDVSVYLVCGDAAFATDVLTGYRSPMWPSVTKRAVIFPLYHAYVQLFVGVFDIKTRTNKENDHFCGRVCLDMAALRSDTEYDVTLPLRASSFVYDRRKRGVIRLRFSLHWFSERAAVLSYFRIPKSNRAFVEGCPTIPCGDPKSFRNVAVTVYGQDLPGKYTRNAFKATFRELSLYQLNVRLLLRVLALDAIFYEKWHVSLYLFFAGMHCVYYETVRMIPPFAVGYILILYLGSYYHYVEKDSFNLGYKSHSIFEIAGGLLYKPESDGSGLSFMPQFIQKRTKRKKGEYKTPAEEMMFNENDIEIEPLDHREFPFSERDKYPKFSVEDALAPGSTKARKGMYARVCFSPHQMLRLCAHSFLLVLLFCARWDDTPTWPPFGVLLVGTAN